MSLGCTRVWIIDLLFAPRELRRAEYTKPTQFTHELDQLKRLTSRLADPRMGISKNERTLTEAPAERLYFTGRVRSQYVSACRPSKRSLPARQTPFSSSLFTLKPAYRQLTPSNNTWLHGGKQVKYNNTAMKCWYSLHHVHTAKHSEINRPILKPQLTNYGVGGRDAPPATCTELKHWRCKGPSQRPSPSSTGRI